MKHLLLSLVVLWGFAVGIGQAEDDKDKKNPLEGAWLAKSIKADGQAAPEEAVKNMRFTFKGDKLLIRGNSRNPKEDDEEESDFTIDDKKSPKELDIVRPDTKKTLQAIYEVKGSELKICIRHESSDKGRPSKFESTPDSQLILVVFKKETKK